MFKPVRLIILISAAFLAGVMVERFNVSEKCKEAGGTMNESLCQVRS
jgi:hypothetical protein